MIDNYLFILNDVLQDIEITKIDEELEKSGLFFGQSNTMNKKNEKNLLQSKYVTYLNDFNIDELSEDEKNNIILLNNIEEKIKFIRKTLYSVIGNKNVENNITLNPASLNRKVPNGTLALEIVVGKNSEKLEGNELKEVLIKQEKYLKELAFKYTKELTRKLSYPVIVFYNRMV